MLDRFGYAPHCLFLAQHPTETAGDFPLWMHLGGDAARSKAVLKLTVEDDPIVEIVAECDEERWRVKAVKANLPKLLHGHNGRPVKNPEEFSLGLTRLAHVLKFVVHSDGHDRVIPGIGSGNQAHLLGTEVMLQVPDPGLKLVWASHSSRRRGQRGPNSIRAGQSTKTSGRIAVAFYDKGLQMEGKLKIPRSQLPDITRVEVKARKGSDLAMEAARLLGKNPNLIKGLASLSFNDAFDLVIRNLALMEGFNWSTGAPKQLKMTKTARMLIHSLGSDIRSPERFEQVLEAYIRNERPCKRTRSETEKQLRSWAVTCHLPALETVVPQRWDQVRNADIPWIKREQTFAKLVRKLNLPSAPDPQVAEVWSQTQFLTELSPSTLKIG